MSDKTYKTAFHLMSAIVVLLLCVMIAMRFIDIKGQKNAEFFSELISESDTVEIVDKITEIKININTASAFELTALPGIGEIKANAIVEYRNEYGRFTELDDLKEINGIGPNTLEQIAPYIVFDDQS